LPGAASPEWREITLGDGAELLAGTKYAIVLRAGSGSSYGDNNYLLWRMNNSSPTYSGGSFGSCSVSGGTESGWSMSEANDFMFEEWGDPAADTHSAAIIEVGNISLSRRNMTLKRGQTIVTVALPRRAVTIKEVVR